MTSAVVAIRRAKVRTGLGPAAGQSRVTRALVGQETELIAGSPTEASAVSKESLAAVVHGRGSLVDRGVDRFPGESGLGEDLVGADRGWRVHGSDAEGLQPGSAEAGVDKVHFVGEAKDSPVNAPVVGQLTGVREGVPRRSTT